MLCIPEHVVVQLRLEVESEREISVADGRKQRVPYVGPVKVRFEDRICFVGAMVLGDEVLAPTIGLEPIPIQDAEVYYLRHLPLAEPADSRIWKPTLDEGRNPALLETRDQQRKPPLWAARQPHLQAHPQVTSTPRIFPGNLGALTPALSAFNVLLASQRSTQQRPGLCHPDPVGRLPGSRPACGLGLRTGVNGQLACTSGSTDG
jgi:hypothetical protein